MGWVMRTGIFSVTRRVKRIMKRSWVMSLILFAISRSGEREMRFFLEIVAIHSSFIPDASMTASRSFAERSAKKERFPVRVKAIFFGRNPSRVSPWMVLSVGRLLILTGILTVFVMVKEWLMVSQMTKANRMERHLRSQFSIKRLSASRFIFYPRRRVVFWSSLLLLERRQSCCE